MTAILLSHRGADDYGMKSYILVMLKTGTNNTTDKAFIDSCFSGHMFNIRELASFGRLVVAGPMEKNENNYRGIFILNTKDFDEAKEWLQKDPAIYHKLLEPELSNWYGSAALPVYLQSELSVFKRKNLNFDLSKCLKY